jgi:hypothetical protein
MKCRATLLVLTALLALPPAVHPAEGGPVTGAFDVSRSVADIMGAQAASGAAAVIPPDEPVRWAFYVPENYDPVSPPGLLVYISPTPSADIPGTWQRVLENRYLIWVGAHDAGNLVNVQRRALLALISPNLVRQDYAVDASRIYVTGLSGGGKMASMMATEYPHVFRGGIFNCGVEFWDRRPSAEQMELIRRNGYVFVTGEFDQALKPTRRVFRRYEKAGIPRIRLMEIDGMGHENPDAAHLDEALEFLDDREADQL